MDKAPVVVLGDIMLDQYHFGKVKRISPEAPHGVFDVNIALSEGRLGGASNVAANLSAMGCNTHLIGNIGSDLPGEKIEALCKTWNVKLHSLLTIEPTPVKERYIAQPYNQQLFRADFEERISLHASQQKSILEYLYTNEPAYVVIADYNKGVMSDELIDQINTMDLKILLDTKSNKVRKYKNIYLLKPNFEEFQQLIGKEIKNVDSVIEEHGKALAQELSCNIVITRGEEGASLITSNGSHMHIQTKAQAVFDVSGAGDTFSAGCITGLLNGMNLHDAVELGNKASGIAVSKIGTTIVTKEELFGS